jgi:hypothetical protein
MYADPSSNASLACTGYTMSAEKCDALSGNWSSYSVPATFTCQNAQGAADGDCHLQGLKFVSAARPISAEAALKCQNLGGMIVPTTQAACENNGGNWIQTSAITTAYACSKVPTDEDECNTVGGIYRYYRSVEGRTEILEGSYAGKVKIHALIDSGDSSYFSKGTVIHSITGTIFLEDEHGRHWTASAPVTKDGNFYTVFNTAYDREEFAFNLNFTRRFNSSFSNELGLILVVTYQSPAP